MPKAISYKKGAVIYFSGHTDERIFILKSGRLLISTVDIESGNTVAEQIKVGEFFGVKSAIGHFPREETVHVIEDAVCIVMTVAEFEQLLHGNRPLIIKMLKVFSKQLRDIHQKLESILNNDVSLNAESGMISAAQAFYKDERWRSCADICLKFLHWYPQSAAKDEVIKMFTISNAHAKEESKNAFFRSESAPVAATSEMTSSIFNTEAFSRFAKNYEPDQVIIAEYEPGDCFYLIQSGSVELVKCVNGQNKNIDILKPGEFFGEMAVLDNSPRSASCVANGFVKCLEFNKANFEILITGNPQIGIILLKLFCKRIYDQKRRFSILLIKDKSARVADVFCMLDEMNFTNDGTQSRRFNLSVQDVANWAGLPYDDVRTEINKFSSAYKIEVGDNHIIVNSIEYMRRLVKNAMPALEHKQD